MKDGPDHIIRFMLFDVNTRRLVIGEREASSIEVVEVQKNIRSDDSLDYVLGHYKNLDLLYVDRNGVARRVPPGGVIPPLDLPPYE